MVILSPALSERRHQPVSRFAMAAVAAPPGLDLGFLPVAGENPRLILLALGVLVPDTGIFVEGVYQAPN